MRNPESMRPTADSENPLVQEANQTVKIAAVTGKMRAIGKGNTEVIELYSNFLAGKTTQK